MPRFDDESLEVLAVLDVVDATLAGEPVDPSQAELAELALLLADERPAVTPGFAQAMDQAVQRRFAAVKHRAASQAPRTASRLRRNWWRWAPASGVAAAIVAAIVIVAAGGSGLNSTSSSSGAPQRAAASASHTSSPSASQTSSPSNSQSASPSSSAAPSGGLQPPQNGRKIVQSAQLALTTAPSRIDQVAQEVFVVVGQVSGFVDSSQVTATNGPGGYAQFQLSIPSSALPQAMASLSGLRYARVASRTDTRQDVNDQYRADVQALNDARALRTALLKQLADATTQAQIDSLTARIHDAEASISSDQATLRSLNRQINYSQVGVTINGGLEPVPVASSGGGFGIGQAAHDAGRVLTVAAGIALIGAAALIPLGLLVALAWWIATAVRRRRREQALDVV